MHYRDGRSRKHRLRFQEPDEGHDSGTQTEEDKMANPAPDIEPVESAEVSATEAAQRSRLRGYDKRLEEWLVSLKDEAGQRSPEVLSALAAKAKEVAEYLEKMAEQARSRQAPDEAGPTVGDESRRDELP
jgi:hypothetical protein